MAEKQIIFRDNQELQSGDLISAQQWQTDALDHLVLDAINDGMAYTGFTLSKTASTQVTVSQGRLYSSGAVYARDEAVVLDFYSDLPVSQKRYFAIVAWGQTVFDDIQPRNFLIDADTGMAEPQSVSMQQTRFANVNYIRGTESADPQFPTTDATQLLIGYVLCDPTGVLSIIQSSATKLDNLSQVATRMALLEIWKAQLSGVIDTLRTDLANLARSLLLYTPLTEFQKMVDLIRILWDRAFRPATFIFYGTDNFLDESQSGVATNVDGAYSAWVHEGLRFPAGGVGWTGTLQLLNSSEPAIKAFDNFIIPKPSGERVRYDCAFPDFPWIADRILQYNFWSWSFRKLRPSRWRHRCGPPYVPSPPAQVFWHQAQKDPTTKILSFAGESWDAVRLDDTFEHDEDDINFPRPGWDRFKFFWRDWVNIPYWSKVFENFSHSGNHICQSFFNAQDGWLSSVTVYLMVPVYQPLTLAISGCDAAGNPDLAHCLRRTELDGPGLQATVEYNPTGEPGLWVGDIEVIEGVGHSAKLVKVPIYVYPCRIPIQPVFLRAGQHFGIHIHSTFDHQFAITDRDDAYQVHQGHFWHSDGSRLVAWLTTPRSLRFRLHYAVWGRYSGQEGSPAGGGIRYEIDLQPLLLAGGIGAVDVLAEAIIPEATTLEYQVRVDNVWKSLASDPNSPVLDGGDSQLQFRVVMTGTTDLMPGVSFANSEVSLSRIAATTFHHISTNIHLGTATNTIKIVAKIDKNFVGAHHTVAASLHYGSTHKTADSVSADDPQMDGSFLRTWNFTVSSVSDFQVEIDGTQDGVGQPFVTQQRIAYAT